MTALHWTYGGKRYIGEEENLILIKEGNEMRGSKIAWNECVDEFVTGLRAREDCEQLLRRLNDAFGLSLTKQALVMAMTPKSATRDHDGPLLRILQEKYPDELERLVVLFKAARTGKRRISRERIQFRRAG